MTVVMVGAAIMILRLRLWQHAMAMAQWRILILMAVAATTIGAHVEDTQHGITER